MFLYLAAFWFIVGVVLQIFWTDLQPRMRIPVDRTMMAFICFFLVCYCLLRWWTSRLLRPPPEREETPAPPAPAEPRVREYNPDLDFSKMDDGKPPQEKPPPP